MNLWQERLRPREREVLHLAAAGYQNKQIALRLGIKTRTVKGHMTRLRQQLGISGERTQLIVLAMLLEIVDLAAVWVEIDRRNMKRDKIHPAAVSVETTNHSVHVFENEHGDTEIHVYDCCIVTVSGRAKNKPTVTVDSEEYPANLIIRQTDSKWLSIKRASVPGPFFERAMDDEET